MQRRQEISSKGLETTGYSLLVHVEVQVRLSDHDPIQHDVEHYADEEGAIAADENGRGSADASRNNTFTYTSCMNVAMLPSALGRARSEDTFG